MFVLRVYVVALEKTCVVPCVVFFFFKQKTAYEMRISDWSSDVCSSDLAPRAREVILVHRREIEPRDMDAAAIGALQPGEHRHQQIGRASCRERVCQYV